MTGRELAFARRVCGAFLLAADGAGGGRRGVSAGEHLAGRWVFTHCDHKPENSLLAQGQLASAAAAAATDALSALRTALSSLDCWAAWHRAPGGRCIQAV